MMSSYRTAALLAALALSLLPATAIAGDDIEQLVERFAGKLAEIARPLAGEEDLAPLFERIGERRVVLLGESTHGTHEYYALRAAISRHLIEEKNYSFIAVEGDWGACMNVNRYVKDLPEAPESAREALSAFDRWPTWLWANEETLELIEWLREYNRQQDPDDRVGFYGIDLYGMADSIEKGPRYLARIDKHAAAQMTEAFDCFAPHAGDPRSYVIGLMQERFDCRDGIVSVFNELRDNRSAWKSENAEAFFHAKQNASLVMRAEEHYRKMQYQDARSWNARARHFHETVHRLRKHYGNDAGAIVWAHNTHVGDVRATQSRPDMETIGMLAREGYDRDNVVIVGFATHRGTVVAGSEWDSPAEVMTVPEAARHSLEDILHRTGRNAALFITDDAADITLINQWVMHRAIGVTYQPQHDRRQNYVPTLWPERYDAFIFIDETRALTPLADDK